METIAPKIITPERVADIIRRHEREREENARTAGVRAIDYVLSIGLDDGPNESARTEAVLYHGEANAAERIIGELRTLLQ